MISPNTKTCFYFLFLGKEHCILAFHHLKMASSTLKFVFPFIFYTSAAVAVVFSLYYNDYHVHDPKPLHPYAGKWKFLTYWTLVSLYTSIFFFSVQSFYWISGTNLFFFYFLVYSVNLLVSVSSEWPIYLKLYTQRWSFAQNCGLYALLCGLSFRNGKF